MDGLAVGLPLGLAFGLADGPTAGIALGFMVVFLGGVMGALAGELAVAFGAGPRPLSTPGGVLRANILFGLALALVFMPVFVLEFGLGFAFELPGRLGLERLSAFVIALAPAFGLVYGAAAARRYLAFLLYMHSALPFRLNSFLTHAYHCQLLRYAGNAYQFRHRELQQWLAAHPTNP